MDKTSVIYTNKAQCRDCYRCLRSCPVKAIEMKSGQASIVKDLCIECGTCIRECPQGAKSYRNDIQLVKEIIAENDEICVSIAPAFAALFTREQQARLPAALRKLGFTYIAETSIGAQEVAKATEKLVQEKPNDKHIATACPTVVSYLEKYHHDMIGMLTPIISPMAAHGKKLKSKFQNAKVVFIGPCLAKKSEATHKHVKPYIDAVLSFDELIKWFDDEAIDINDCSPLTFDETGPHCASLFPIEGGLLKTADMDTDILSNEVHAISGVEEIEDLVRDIEDGTHDGAAFIEPLFCHNGCINGPLFGCSKTMYQRRRDLLSYVETKSITDCEPQQSLEELSVNFSPINLFNDKITEEKIKEVLEKTGKHTEEDELNCGACGYSSCRDKAIAVIRNMAETEMCIPYMRRMAEQRTDKIIETNPNGVVILDKHFNILHMNPAFCTTFTCTKAVLGKNISYLIDPEPFERLAAGENDLIEESVKYARYNLECRQIIYKLHDEQQYVGMFINITDAKADQAKLEKIRSSAVTQAQELLQHQISMAQQMAKFLGESTAQGEQLVEKIMNLVQEDSSDESQKPTNDVQDIVITKPKVTLGVADIYRKH